MSHFKTQPATRQLNIDQFITTEQASPDLKSLRHIEDDSTRIAIALDNIQFALQNNETISEEDYTTAIVDLICSLATQDPNKIIYENVRIFIKSKLNTLQEEPKRYQNDIKFLESGAATDLLARHTLNCIKKLKTILVVDDSLSEDSLRDIFPWSLKNPPLDLDNQLNQLKIGSVNKAFLSILTNLSPRGKDTADELIRTFEKNVFKSKTLVPESVFSFWVNCSNKYNGTLFISNALLVFILVIWEDLLNEKSLIAQTLSILPTDKCNNSPKKSYPTSSHLVEQKLKTRPALSIAKKEIFACGIRNLSTSEHRTIRTISLLLHQKNGPEVKSIEGYNSLGLLKNAIISDVYGGQQPSIIMINESEYCQAFYGRPYGGSEKIHALKALKELGKKSFQITYDRTYKVGKAEKTDRIIFNAPIIETAELLEGLTNKEKSKTTKKASKKKLIIVASQLFTDQIQDKFVKYPIDYNDRMAKAAGNAKKVTTAMHLFIDYCLKEISANRKESTLNEEKLIVMLELEEMINNRQTQRVDKSIEKTIEMAKSMGIIKDANRVKNKTDGYKWIFKYNASLDW